MIRSLRVYFLSRQLREKILLLFFILFGTLWWLSATINRGTKFRRDVRQTTSELAIQQQWLDKRAAIKQAADKAAARLDSAQTLDRAKLVNEVSTAATDVGLKNGSAANFTSETAGQFTIHSIEYQVRDADYEALMKFYLKLNGRAPYIGIERFILSPTSLNDTSKLTLNLRISSVEIPR